MLVWCERLECATVRRCVQQLTQRVLAHNVDAGRRERERHAVVVERDRSHGEGEPCWKIRRVSYVDRFSSRVQVEPQQSKRNRAYLIVLYML